MPENSKRTDLFIYTGSDQQLRREDNTASRTGNALTIAFADLERREVFVQFVNEHSDRTVSFVGEVTPESVVAAPAQGAKTSTAGPVASTLEEAITVGVEGRLSGTIAPRRAVWYRFWYGNPGADATVSVTVAPTADSFDLTLYTGSGTSKLTAQRGAATRSGDTLTRRVSLPSAQFVYVTVVNNREVTTLAYSGQISPAFASPAPLSEVVPTPQPSPTPQPEVEEAPPMRHDERYFFETNFRIDDDRIWAFFNARGQVDIFGFAVSRTFTFLGCKVQVFQRQVAQVCEGGVPAFMNVGDPELFPFIRVNFSTFPAANEQLKAATPKVVEPDYDTRILRFVRNVARDHFEGVPVNFERTLFGLITPQMAGTSDPGILGMLNLQAWGAPISHPARDPNNPNFVYQRFQRGIMHHDLASGVTRGILLADYLKQIIRSSEELPPDLRQQAQDMGSRFFAQYCPGQANWLCRPGELPGTDLTFAFEQG